MTQDIPVSTDLGGARGPRRRIKWTAWTHGPTEAAVVGLWFWTTIVPFKGDTALLFALSGRWACVAGAERSGRDDLPELAQHFGMIVFQIALNPGVGGELGEIAGGNDERHHVSSVGGLSELEIAFGSRHFAFHQS